MSKLKSVASVTSILNDVSAIAFRVVILMVIFLSYENIHMILSAVQ
jgi:hypothetical protein